VHPLVYGWAIPVEGLDDGLDDWLMARGWGNPGRQTRVILLAKWGMAAVSAYSAQSQRIVQAILCDCNSGGLFRL
jgi:hypothetical protein